MRLHHLVATLAALSLAAASGTSSAAPGDLDTSFGNSGRTAVSTFTIGGDLVIQADGKIVVGSSANGFRVARFGTNGFLDPAYGSSGFSDTAPIASFAIATAVALQADGFVVGAGTQASGSGHADFALARWDADGHLDASFGSGGAVVTALTADDDIGDAVALQSDGKIVLVGYATISGQRVFALARYETDGDLDPTFGTGGVVTTTLGFGDKDLDAVAVQPDGRIVVAGYSQFGNASVLRYEDDGDLDPTFGTGGIVPAPSGSFFRGDAIALQPDGKILVGGVGGIPYGFIVARFDGTGALDTGFGSGGITRLRPPTHGNVFDFALQDNGSIVVAGSFLRGVKNDFQLVRLLANGLVDPTFGGGNSVVTDINNLDNSLLGVGIQTDGKIVGSGIAEVIASDFRLTVARYLGVGPCETGAFVDSDGDTLCDAADPCHNPTARTFLAKPKAVAALKKGDDGIDGNDGFKFRATADLPDASSFAALDPIAEGARLILYRKDGSVVIDATLPGGAAAGHGTAGWELLSKGTKWSFSDTTASPVNGIYKLEIRDLGTKAPGRVKVSGAGREGDYPGSEADYPLRATVVLGDSTASAAGLCVEGQFAP